MIETVAGWGDNDYEGFNGDGSFAINATLFGPSAVALDQDGNLFISESSGNAVRVIDAVTGIIQTFAGKDAFLGDFSGDGGPASNSTLNAPVGLAYDGKGNSLYIADSYNYRIRFVNLTTGIMGTFAGNGDLQASTLSDGGQAINATLGRPSRLVIYKGDLFFSDFYNSVVRKINMQTGIISHVAGRAGYYGYSGDGGPAWNATLYRPSGLAVDPRNGDLYICDVYNNMTRVVRGGTISTEIGGGSEGLIANGDGGPANKSRLSFPRGIAIDSQGNLFVADSGHQSIRMVLASSRIITTVAGDGRYYQGYNMALVGDGGPATSAQLNGPVDVSEQALIKPPQP